MVLLAAGCDIGPRDEQPAHGPALHVLATYPADGQGTNTALDAGVGCDSPTPDCAVPTNVAIELRFDRFLLPGAGIGLGLSLFTGNPAANAVSLSAHYDLIERVVTFQTAAPLQPNTLYTAQVLRSTDPNRGFWAFDRAPVEEGPVPLTFSFTTGDGPRPTIAAQPTTDTCTTLTSGAAPNGPLNACSFCHQDPKVAANAYPPMGLSLSDWGLFYTGIGHVAHETQTGNSALAPGLQSAPRFGVQMSIVLPGSPENSYLMYKLLRRPENYELAEGEPCGSALHSPVSDASCSVPDPGDAELARLREWFVLGDPMPKDEGSAVQFARADLARVANWISAGAACDAR
jgi:Bacterial Ig-like domain